MSNDDVIDRLAGLAPGSPLAMIRDRKPVTRQQAQASYRALFEPADSGRCHAAGTFRPGEVRRRPACAGRSCRVLCRRPGAHRAGRGFCRGADRRKSPEAGAVGPYGAYPKGSAER